MRYAIVGSKLGISFDVVSEILKKYGFRNRQEIPTMFGSGYVVFRYRSELDVTKVASELVRRGYSVGSLDGNFSDDGQARQFVVNILTDEKEKANEKIFKRIFTKGTFVTFSSSEKQ